MGFSAGNIQIPSGELPGGASTSSNGVELSKQENKTENHNLQTFNTLSSLI